MIVLHGSRAKIDKLLCKWPVKRSLPVNTSKRDLWSHQMRGEDNSLMWGVIKTVLVIGLLRMAKSFRSKPNRKSFRWSLDYRTRHTLRGLLLEALVKSMELLREIKMISGIYSNVRKYRIVNLKTNLEIRWPLREIKKRPIIWGQDVGMKRRQEPRNNRSIVLHLLSPPKPRFGKMARMIRPQRRRRYKLRDRNLSKELHKSQGARTERCSLRTPFWVWGTLTRTSIVSYFSNTMSGVTRAWRYLTHRQWRKKLDENATKIDLDERS